MAGLGWPDVPQVTKGHKLLSQTNMAEGEGTNTAGGAGWGGLRCICKGAIPMKGPACRLGREATLLARTWWVMALEPSVVCQLLSQGERRQLGS